MKPPSLDELFYHIVDKFEAGTPTALFWIAWDEDADFQGGYCGGYEDGARDLLARVTPKGYVKLAMVWRSIKPLPYPWLFGFTDHFFRDDHLPAMERWRESFPRHHDLFIQY